MRVTPWVLLAVLIADSSGQGARAQTDAALSLPEIAIADCVGLALALEEAARVRSDSGERMQTATLRTDMLLSIAITRHVAVGRVALFRRRAALAQAAETLRMGTAIDITGSATRVIARAEREFARRCGAYLESS